MSRLLKTVTIIVLTVGLALGGGVVASGGIYDAYKVVFGEARWQTKYNNLVDALGNSLTSLSNLITGWAPVQNQDILLPVAATYSSGTTFTVPGDYTAQFAANAKVRVDLGSGTLKGSYVASSSYGGGVTTVILHDSVLTNPISGVWVTATRNGLWPYGDGEVNALDYASGTPSLAGLQAAIAAIDVNSRTLRLPSGTWPITADLSIPANITLKVERGATLAVSTTKTLTLNGDPDAGLYQIFSCIGTGKVTLAGALQCAYPQWWGATGDGVTDDSTAIQAAINSGAAIYLPVSTKTTHNPVARLLTNYYLGSTGLTFTAAVKFRAEDGTALVYDGTGAALTIDCTTTAIADMVIEFYDIYSSGAYGIKITGHASNPNYHYLQHARIKGRTIWWYTVAGVYVDTLFSESDIDIQSFYPDYSAPPPTAWAYYFTKGHADVRWECNHIKSNTCYTGQGAYLPSGFQYGWVNISADPNVSYLTNPRIVVGGIHNHIVITSATPQGNNYPTSYPLDMLSGAKGNVISCSAWMLNYMSDANPIGDNLYLGVDSGRENYLLNPSFESFDAGPEAIDWTRGNVTVSRETTYFKHGNSGVKITNVGAGGNLSQAIPASLIGKPMAFSGWFMAPVTNTNQFGAVSAFGTQNQIIPKDGKWHFISVFDTVQATPGFVSIYTDVTGGSAAADVIYADGCSLTVGSVPAFPGTDFGHHLYSKSTWDPASTATGAIATVDVSCIGAAVGDPVTVGFAGSGVIAGCVFNGSVKTTDVVTVTFVNHSATNPLDLGSGTLTVRVHKDR